MIQANTPIPPHSKLAEGQVLGSMLLGGDAIPDVRTICTAEDFYIPAHQTIFRVLVEMFEQSKPIDLATTFAEFAQRKLLASIGQGTTDADGGDYLTDLVEGVPDRTNAAYHAGIVRDKATLRRLIQAGHKLTSEAYNDPEDVESLVTEHESRLFDIATGSNGDLMRSYSTGQAVQEVLDRAEAVATGELPMGLETGFGQIERSMGGIQPGALITLAADTGVGKTALALSMAANVADKGKSVLFVSAEMPERELAHRLLAIKSGVPSGTIRGGRFTDKQIAAIKEARAAMGNWSLELWARTATVADIASKARHIAMRRKAPLDLIVVDYLQLMRPTQGDNRAQQVGGIAWGLKQLAMDLKVPVLILSQLNREHAKSNRPPTKHDLKESGDVENHSNAVWLLYNPPEGEADTDGAEIIYFKVAKAREGCATPWPRKGEETAGAIKLRFKSALTRFEPKRL